MLVVVFEATIYDYYNYQTMKRSVGLGCGWQALDSVHYSKKVGVC